MNLMNQFKSLSTPDGDFFSAEKIDCISKHRIGKSLEGYPVILFDVQRSLINCRNIYLQYVKVYTNIACRIFEDGQSYTKNYAIIVFQSGDYIMHEYFLKISESLLSSLSEEPTEREVLDIINKFVELLKALVEAPIKSVQGLWAELCLITVSPNPTVLMQCWHCKPENRFDFEDGDKIIEVKSAIGDKRIHHFSLEQLDVSTAFQVIIASVLLRRSNVGVTVLDLRQQIVGHLGTNFELIQKLDRVIAKTLGEAILDASQIAFDYNKARESIQYYYAENIPKIRFDSLPSGISDVRFKVDFEYARPYSSSFPSSFLCS